MKSCYVTTMQSEHSNGVWFAKCYKDGNLVHIETVSTAEQAQAYATEWLADQVDAELIS